MKEKDERWEGEKVGRWEGVRPNFPLSFLHPSRRLTPAARLHPVSLFRVRLGHQLPPEIAGLAVIFQHLAALGRIGEVDLPGAGRPNRERTGPPAC